MNIVYRLSSLAEEYRKERPTEEDHTKAFDEILTAARNDLPLKDTLEPAALATRNATEEALKQLERKRKELGKLGDYGLAAVLSHISVGNFDIAVAQYIRHTSNISDLLAVMHAQDAASLEAKQRLDAAKKRALAILKDVGSVAARYALPAILTVLRP